MNHWKKTAPVLVVRFVCATLLAAACSSRPSNASDWVAVRDTIGDTIVVRTVSGSTMGPLSYIEELSIGQLDGPPEYTLGQPGCVRADGHGGVYVFDMQVPALMQYDSMGKYVRTIGREGEGPGEYELGCSGIRRHPDGGIVMADEGNLRINIYASGGEFVNTIRKATQAMRSAGDVDVDAGGRIYETGRIMAGDPPRWTEILVTHDAEGAILDTIFVPVLPGEQSAGSFGWLPIQSTDFSPALGLVISDPMDYRVYVGHEAESVLRIERDAELVVPFAEELENLRRYTNRGGFLGRELKEAFDQLPDRKPFIRNVRVMDDSRIWVLVHSRAEHVPSDRPQPEGAEPAIEWREPNHYDVFEPDGTYLGRLELSRGEWIVDASGDELWILRRGELDEAYIVRGRLVGR